MRTSKSIRAGLKQPLVQDLFLIQIGSSKFRALNPDASVDPRFRRRMTCRPADFPIDASHRQIFRTSEERWPRTGKTVRGGCDRRVAKRCLLPVPLAN